MGLISLEDAKAFFKCVVEAPMPEMPTVIIGGARTVHEVIGAVAEAHRLQAENAKLRLALHMAINCKLTPDDRDELNKVLTATDPATRKIEGE